MFLVYHSVKIQFTLIKLLKVSENKCLFIQPHDGAPTMYLWCPLHVHNLLVLDESSLPRESLSSAEHSKVDSVPTLENSYLYWVSLIVVVSILLGHSKLWRTTTLGKGHLICTLRWSITLPPHLITSSRTFSVRNKHLAHYLKYHPILVSILLTWLDFSL